MQVAQQLGQLGQEIGKINFEMRRGVAVPKDDTTLGAFQGLQRAINKVLGSNIAEDGDIGPTTFEFAKRALSRFPSAISASTQASLANVEALARSARSVALSLGIAGGFTPDFTPRRAALPPAPAVGPDGLPAPSPALDIDSGNGKGVHWAWWVVGGVAVLGAAYLGYRFFRKRPAFAGADDFGYDDAPSSFIDV